MNSNAMDELKLFLAISVELTGFSESELTGTGMLKKYYSIILQNNTADNVKYFFENAKAILNTPRRTPETTSAAIKTQLIPSSQYGALAKNIIMLWYTGSLFDMSLTGQPNSVVSAESYKQGLMWDAGHTHPPGAKQPGYGSWAHPPITVK